VGRSFQRKGGNAKSAPSTNQRPFCVGRYGGAGCRSRGARRVFCLWAHARRGGEVVASSGRVIAYEISSNNNKVLPWSTIQGPIMRSPSSRSSMSILGIKRRSPWACPDLLRWLKYLRLSRFKLAGPPTLRDTEASNAYAIIHDSLGPVCICRFAQFIAVCRRSKMVSMGTRKPRRGSRHYWR
jgi:hypothetical protein